MEVTNVLLVAVMFVILLSLGIGNLLIGLASRLDRRTGVTVVLGSGFTSAATLNAIAAALMLALMRLRNRRTPAAGLLAAWTLFLVASVLRATGVT